MIVTRGISATSASPPAARAVAANQPVTPITETLRGLLLGTPIGSYGWQALAWCAGLLLAAFAAATILFRRRTTN